MHLIEVGETGEDRLLGASCTLSDADVRARLGEWAALRERSTEIREISGGVAISLDPQEPIDRVANLAARESECCPFYTFTVRLEGPSREMQITAGQGRELAVRTLLGLS
jgi:hypothetical protein